MLAKRIIPCLDVREGRVTKGIKFQNNQDVGDPVEMAHYYYDEGADELVFYDIGASPGGQRILLDWVSRVAENIHIPFSVGGGIRSLDDIRQVFGAGAEKVSLNTAAVLDPNLISEGAKLVGSQSLVVGMDVKQVVRSQKSEVSKKHFPSGYEIYINGGRQATGLDAIVWAKRIEELGAGEICLNSIDADGTKEGYDLALTAMIVDAVSIPVIASGGAGSTEDIVEVFQKTNCDAALVASIVHYGEVSIRGIKKILKKRGLVVRV